jgi:hypothetical protein
VTLHWGSCEPPAEAFFAFFSFSLFDRTSLAEAFLCVTYIESNVQERRNVGLTRSLSMTDVDYRWMALLPSDAFIVSSKRCIEEKAFQTDRCRRFVRVIVDNEEKNVRPRGARSQAV